VPGVGVVGCPLTVRGAIIAYEDEGYPDGRLAGEIAQSVDIGQIEVRTVPSARVRAGANAIEIAAVDGSATERAIIARFGEVPIP